VSGFKEAGDDYSYIMAEALADRLAEAYAEKLHEMVRRELWGYAPDEDLSVDDMLKVKYQVRNVMKSAWCCRPACVVRGAITGD
jgi:5-methyltetrahydrofolate--homocysteine methyltransferase